MLPQFGLTEFLLVAVIALIVVGPKDLPMMMRKLGQFVAKGRAMAREFQSAFDDIARQAELDELRKEIEDLRRDNQLTQAVDDLKRTEADINRKVMMENPRPKGTEGGTGPGDVPGTQPEKAPHPETPPARPAVEGGGSAAPAATSEETPAGDAEPAPSGRKAPSS